MLPIEALQERIKQSELGQEWIHDPLMNQDIWALEELGSSKEECHISGYKNLRFEKFFLTWLKMLAKSTAKASIRQKSPISVVYSIVNNLKNLDNFLVNKGFTQPETLNDSLLQQFISEKNTNKRQSIIAYALNLWAEEKWLVVNFVSKKYKFKTPKIETIPEEVLYQIYENFDLLPAPLERLFRLQLVIGCRIGELLKMPRQCLKKEADKWFLLRWIEKRKHWKFFQIHSLVAELVQEQQKFLDTQIEKKSNFDRLFCWLSTGGRDLSESERRDAITGKFVHRGGRFDVEPVYKLEPISLAIISLWLRDFSKQADLKDKHCNKFQLKSHMFRRTKASIMAYCEAEDEYIAAILGHGSLDMLPHYRNRSLDRLEKEAQAKGYVDMYGRVTTFKPRKRRYERLAELLKVTTPLGECHRPTMLGDCQYRYACLSCDHHRVTLEDQPKLKADIQHYAPPTREQIAEVDLPFQELLLNPDNKFLPWQSLPESLLKNPKAHELDLEIAPRLIVYGHCTLDPKTLCPVNLFPKCYGCSSFRPSTGKLPLYERQYQGEQQRLTEAEKADAELASEEAKATMTAMDKWLPELRRLANG